MRKQWSYTWTKVALICAALTLGAAVWFICRDDGNGYGHLRLNAADAYSLTPVKGAYIVLPESGISAYANDEGMVTIYNVPIDMPRLFRERLGASYGETSIFVYAEGYLPCALLHVRVYPNRVRPGPTVYLFPEGETGVSVTTLIESPDEGEMERLLDMFAP